jgi:ubiquinone biosynthesis UbiH/UbiF/VisC/COQ6 family hydroxylase
MEVEGDAHARLAFSAYDLHERALAWIVEERVLRAALLETTREAGVDIHGGSPFVGLTFDTEDAALTLAPPGGEPKTLRARLIVAADGLRSWVRQAAGIVAEPRSYGQTGVVANFAGERAHRGVARQWFRPDGGVLAWLPLPDQCISMVWSAPDALAADLLALAPEALAGRVAEAGGHALGVLTSISPSAGFPLSILRPPTTVAHRLALVGDAAHGVHPLAGQGVNLGFGDARVLAQLLAERGPVTDPGAPILLSRYAQRRVEPVLAMQVVTDGLARLFGPPSPWLSAVRNAGMAAVDRLPFLKRALAQPALR